MRLKHTNGPYINCLFFHFNMYFIFQNSPFSLCARALRPHSGIFHCCAFCSTGGSKLATCACLGTMADFNGCGHGHDGHPGRRHWSCCANILENSECSKANAVINCSV